MSASFMGISFGLIQTQGRGEKISFPDRTNYAAQDSNYGSDTILQILGRKSGEFARQVFATPAQWASLKARREQQGALQLHTGGETRTATLISVDEGSGDPGDVFVIGTVTWYL